MSFGLDDFFSVCNNGKTRLLCKIFHLRYAPYVTYIIVNIQYY
jgi:hypothetical protein